MNCFNLGGHSGCGIFLYEKDNGKKFVRKISKDVLYNERLKVQCDKQRSFPSGEIRTPKILNTGFTDDGLFYFDMEYIHGVTLAEYIKTIEIGKIHQYVEKIVNYMISGQRDKGNPQPVFASKISSLKKTLSCYNNLIIYKAMLYLEKHDWSPFESSRCHGDMTLENIIIRNDDMYYIDFLDSFYDSWLMDAGTLLQDIQTLWSYRNDSISMNTIIRLIVFRDLLVDKVSALNQSYIPEMYYALLLKLIRIYPYTADEKTYHFLDEKTKIVLDIIDSM